MPEDQSPDVLHFSMPIIPHANPRIGLILVPIYENGQVDYADYFNNYVMRPEHMMEVQNTGMVVGSRLMCFAEWCGQTHHTEFRVVRNFRTFITILSHLTLIIFQPENRREFSIRDTSGTHGVFSQLTRQNTDALYEHLLYVPDLVDVSLETPVPMVVE